MRDILVHDGAIVTPNSHATLLLFSRNGILFPAELGGWIDGSGVQRGESVSTGNGRTYRVSYQDSFYTVDSRIACRVPVLFLRPVRSEKLFPSSICPCLASSVGVFKIIPTPRTVNWIVFESIRDSWSCHSDHTAQKSLSNSDGNIKGFDGSDLAETNHQRC